MEEILAFGEFISSNDFPILLLRAFDIVNPYTGLGIYIQGIPIANVMDFVWGTNAGIRTLPMLIWLSFLEKLFAENWEYAYLFISFIFPFCSFLLAQKLVKKLTLFSVLGAIFYVGNVWAINRLFSGFWQLNIAYAFLPILVVIPLKITLYKKQSIKSIVFFASLFALAASLVMIAQPHFLIMIALFSVSHMFLISLRRQFSKLRRLVSFYAIFAIIFFFINAYFLVPSILYPEIRFTAPNQYFSLAAVAFNGQGNSIEHVLRFEPLGFNNINFRWTWLEYFQFLPFMLFVALVFLNKNRNYLFFTLAILFLFFSKGLNPPGENLSNWIYQNIFFMQYFRDPSRFLAGVALLSAFSISDFTLRRRISREVKVLIVAFGVLLFLIVNIKSFQYPKINILKETAIPKYYFSMQDFINNELSANISQRLLILPNAHGATGYPWYDNKSPISSNTIFTAVIPLSIPLADSTNHPDNYSNQVSSYLYNEFTKNYDHNLLRPLGAKYLLVDSSIVKPETERKIAKEARQSLVNDKKSYTLLHEEGDLSLFKINENNLVLTNSKPLFAIGDLSTIAKNYASGSARPLVLLNQYPNFNVLDSIDYSNKDLLIDLENPELVLTAESLSGKYSLDILKAGWDYDKIFSNYEPYKMEYVIKTGELFTSGRLVASRINGFMHIDHKLSSGKYQLLIKLISGGDTSFEIKVGDVSKKNQVNTHEKLIWIDGGIMELKKPADFVTLTKFDPTFVAIDHMLIVPYDVYQDEIAKISSYLNKMEGVKDAVESRHEQDKFVITADKVIMDRSVKYLTYRLSYGNHWQSNVDSEKFIGDGYGMTYVNNDGKLEKISYFPNTIYKFSLLLSILTLIGSLLYIIIYAYKRFSLNLFYKH
jgi:hypothetical protein